MSDVLHSASEAARLQEDQFFRDSRILVVDDEPFNVDLLRFELEDRGFQVLTAGDGLAALALLDAGERPDLALLDVMMPGLDGFGLTREIRRRPGLEKMPVILLTAKSELEDKAEGFTARADDYVLKPFEIDDLLARVLVQLRIGVYLKRRRSQLEAHSRVAMVGAAAHELAQPLAGASGYLQLLQAAVERTGSATEGFEGRIERIEHCLQKTRDVALRLEQLERVILEDYPCGAQIINIHETARPEEARDPDDPHLVLLLVEAGASRDQGVERELARQGVELLHEDDLAGREAQVDLILLSAQDRLDLVCPVLERLERLWAAPQLLLPPRLALLPGQGLSRGSPGVDLMRHGVDDVLCRPFRLEELFIRIRSRVRLQRLRLGDLRLQSLGAAHDVRRSALTGFLPLVEACLQRVPALRRERTDIREALTEFARQLDGLTSTVRRLQARNVPGLAGPDQVS